MAAKPKFKPIRLEECLERSEHELIPWDGPTGAPVAAIGEAPAIEELKEHMAFVGASGKILWQWLWKYCRIQRGEILVGNLFPFMLPEKKGKDVDELLEPAVMEHYAQELRFRLLGGLHKYILTLGRWSTRALLGDVDMEWAHGLGFEWQGHVVIPCFHPAAGLHSPDRLQFTAHDLAAARRIMDGEQGLWKSEAGLMYDYHAWRGPISPALGADEAGVDTEGTIDRPYSIQVSIADREAWLIHADDQEGVATLREWFARYRPLVILHNAPHDTQVARAMGIDFLALGCRLYDTMTASHVLQTEPRGLKPLSTRLLGIEMEDYTDITWPEQERVIRGWLEAAKTYPWPHPGGRKKPIPKRIDTLLAKTGAKFREAWGSWEIRNKVVGTVGPPPEIDYEKVDGFTIYACRDADVTRRDKAILQARIEEEGLQGVLDLDLACLPFLDQIRKTALYCDLEKLVALHADIQMRKDSITQVIRALVDDEKFNPGSADQVEAKLRPYLHKLAAKGRCKLTKSKKRYQADDSVLKQIADEDDLVPAVLEYRELDKLDKSYLNAIYPALRYDEETGLWRYPVDVGHAHVVSGRLNGRILTWPTTTEDGRRLRGCFVAPPGWVMGSWDLSQIELRLAAAYSGDPVMREALVAGLDIHSDGAAKLFGKTYEECNDKHGPGRMLYRHPTKTTSYLILYGGQEDRLFTELAIMKVKGFDRPRCARFIHDWLELYHVLRDYIDATNVHDAAKGYASTPLGRRRYLPALGLLGSRWPFAKLREEAQRQDFNFEVQGGAQDLLKESEPKVMELRANLGGDAAPFQPCLQMHDEIIALVRPEAWDVVNPMMQEIMHDGEEINGVPLECEGHWAEDWGGLK